MSELSDKFHTQRAERQQAIAVEAEVPVACINCAAAQYQVYGVMDVEDRKTQLQADLASGRVPPEEYIWVQAHLEGCEGERIIALESLRQFVSKCRGFCDGCQSPERYKPKTSSLTKV